jgi:hypothetical protein
MQAGNASPPITSNPFNFSAVESGQDIRGKAGALKDQLQSVKEDIGALHTREKSVKTAKGARMALRESLVGAGSKKGAVYLRHSDSEGIIFSQKRGVLARLGLSDGGHRTALQKLQKMAPGLDVGGAGPRDKIEVDKLKNPLDRAIAESSADISKTHAAINRFAARRKEIEVELADADKALALRKGAVAVWCSNVGAAFINGVCREAYGTLRAGGKPVKPTLGQVAAFYAKSDEGSAYNNFSSAVQNSAREFLALGGAEMAGKVNAALTDRASVATYYRGAQLSDKEILPFMKAQQGMRPVRASFFMAVTTDPKTAASFAKGTYGGAGGGRQVTFHVNGSPFRMDGPYEMERIFKPGTLFNVGRIQDNGEKMTIDLVACKPDARDPVNI